MMYMSPPQLHHQVLPQVFSFDATTGTIILNATGACLTASDDPDSGSHTPAVELQPCGHGTGTQTWEYSTDTLNICPKGNTRKCIDQDTSDKHAEMYGCGNKQINQQWLINAEETGHIQQAGLDKLCMSPCPDSDIEVVRERAWRRAFRQRFGHDAPAHVRGPF
eukprot:m.694681 g.694681  ORF g.694681 m.694681 type:complete len:164 (-) comp22884_c2_seq3:1472-1963(-)